MVGWNSCHRLDGLREQGVRITAIIMGNQILLDYLFCQFDCIKSSFTGCVNEFKDSENLKSENTPKFLRDTFWRDVASLRGLAQRWQQKLTGVEVGLPTLLPELITCFTL